MNVIINVEVQRSNTHIDAYKCAIYNSKLWVKLIYTYTLLHYQLLTWIIQVKSSPETVFFWEAIVELFIMPTSTGRIFLYEGGLILLTHLKTCTNVSKFLCLQYLVHINHPWKIWIQIVWLHATTRKEVFHVPPGPINPLLLGCGHRFRDQRNFWYG